MDKTRKDLKGRKESQERADDLRPVSLYIQLRSQFRALYYAND